MAKVVGQLLPYGVWRSATSIIRVHWAPSSKTQTRTSEMTWTNQEKTSMAHCTPSSSASQWLSPSASVMCWCCFFFFDQKHAFAESMRAHSRQLMRKCSRYRFRQTCKLFFAWNLLQRSVNLFLAVMVDLCVVRGQWNTDSELNVAKPLSIYAQLTKRLNIVGRGKLPHETPRLTIHNQKKMRYEMRARGGQTQHDADGLQSSKNSSL